MTVRLLTGSMRRGAQESATFLLLLVVLSFLAQATTASRFKQVHNLEIESSQPGDSLKARTMLTAEEDTSRRAQRAEKETIDEPPGDYDFLLGLIIGFAISSFIFLLFLRGRSPTQPSTRDRIQGKEEIDVKKEESAESSNQTEEPIEADASNDLQNQIIKSELEERIDGEVRTEDADTDEEEDDDGAGILPLQRRAPQHSLLQKSESLHVNPYNKVAQSIVGTIQQNTQVHERNLLALERKEVEKQHRKWVSWSYNCTSVATICLVLIWSIVKTWPLAKDPKILAWWLWESWSDWFTRFTCSSKSSIIAVMIGVDGTFCTILERLNKSIAAIFFALVLVTVLWIFSNHYRAIFIIVSVSLLWNQHHHAFYLLTIGGVYILSIFIFLRVREFWPPRIAQSYFFLDRNSDLIVAFVVVLSSFVGGLIGLIPT